MKNQKLKGNFMILLSALICGISFVVQSKGVEQIPPMTFNGIRSLLGGFALLPIIYFIDKSKRKKGISVQCRFVNDVLHFLKNFAIHKESSDIISR